MLRIEIIYINQYSFFSHSIAVVSIHVENITVTQSENIRFQCQFPSDFNFNENIIQWKKYRSLEDNILISINGKIPKRFEKTYQTSLTNQSSSFDIFHVDKQDSTTYICQTFETQTILCQYNLIVLSKY